MLCTFEWFRENSLEVNNNYTENITFSMDKKCTNFRYSFRQKIKLGFSYR